MSFLNEHSLVLSKIFRVVGEVDCDVSVGDRIASNPGDNLKFKEYRLE